MADVIVDQVAPEDVTILVGLYNQMFRPPRGEDHFERRYLGRHHVVQMVARMDERAVGFLVGFELKPRVFFLWFVGVLPANRRQGVGLQLLEAGEAWAREHDYESVRCEVFNQQKPMLHFLLHAGFDVIGLRWDHDHGDNLVLFQKTLA
ncbi:MAG: GNAT family N-acetyltransferase [Gemmataceae bacterium]